MTASAEAPDEAERRAHGAASPRPKVLFLMGSGHSGSTILGVTLGNCDGFFYAGELDNWLVRKGASLLGGTERTRFWNQVRDGVEGAEGAFGPDAQRYLERSSAILRPGKAAARDAVRRRWRPVTEELYRSIARTAGATHIVDSAHFPLRARELKQLEGIDVYLVFLVRDPQQVVHSFVKHINRHALAERRWRTLVTNLDMSLTYLLATLVFLRAPRARRALLRHEDFLADPEGVLRAIFALTGSDAGTPDLGSLQTGFPMQGNRLIKSEMVSFRGSGAHPPRPPRHSTLTAVIQRPWELVFSLLRPRMRALGADER
jgi:Sulfotransferase family